MMPELQSLECVLQDEDLLSIQIGVDQLFWLLVKQNASPCLRKDFCQLLHLKSAEVTNRAVGAYLKSVAHSLEQLQ